MKKDVFIIAILISPCKKYKKVPLRAVKTFKRKRVGQIDLFRIINPVQ